MTTTPGNGPLPSGTATNASISSLPDVSFTVFVVTSADAAAGNAAAARIARTVHLRIFGSPVTNAGAINLLHPIGHGQRVRRWADSPAKCAGAGSGSPHGEQGPATIARGGDVRAGHDNCDGDANPFPRLEATDDD